MKKSFYIIAFSTATFCIALGGVDCNAMWRMGGYSSDISKQGGRGVARGLSQKQTEKNNIFNSPSVFYEPSPQLIVPPSYEPGITGIDYGSSDNNDDFIPEPTELQEMQNLNGDEKKPLPDFKFINRSKTIF